MGNLDKTDRYKTDCREKQFTVPSTYDAFEAEVREWVRHCLQSRTEVAGGPARREREPSLVPGSRAPLWDVWERVRDRQGQRITIKPTYVGRNRAEEILYTSPEACDEPKPDEPSPHDEAEEAQGTPADRESAAAAEAEDAHDESDAAQQLAEKVNYTDAATSIEQNYTSYVAQNPTDEGIVEPTMYNMERRTRLSGYKDTIDGFLGYEEEDFNDDLTFPKDDGSSVYPNQHERDRSNENYIEGQDRAVQDWNRMPERQRRSLFSKNPDDHWRRAQDVRDRLNRIFDQATH